MNRIEIMAIVLLIYVVYAAFKHKEVWKKLTPKQILGVLVTFVGVVAIGGVILYYGAHYVEATAMNQIYNIVAQYVGAIIIVIFCVVIFNIIVSKITNGILPIKRTPK